MSDASTDTDPVAIAIEICNKNEFKTQVFSTIYSDMQTLEDCKRSWDEKIESITVSLLEDYAHLDLEMIQQDIIGAVFPIALRMLMWIEFYSGTFGFARDFCLEFLEPSLFTSKGIIDAQKVETKMSGEALNPLQRFQLASFYCQWRDIPRLFNNLSSADKNLVYNESNPELIKQLEIVKFWSYHTKGDLDKLTGAFKIDQFRLKTAVTSGSQVAVNFCLERVKSKQSSSVDTIVTIFRHRIRREIRKEHLNFVDDWVVFRNERFSSIKESWVPDTFFADIFYSVLSGMSELQMKDFWRQIFDTRFQQSDKRITSQVYANVLDHFLCWPYQDMFFELFKWSWQHLKLKVFVFLLFKIFNRIEPKSGDFWYGEEKSYDYRNLLVKVWNESPESTKRVLFRKYAQPLLGLIKSIYKLQNFTEQDRANLRSIIKSATENEQYYYMMSDEGIAISTMLLENRRLDLFEELVTICFEDLEKAKGYKLEVILRKAMKNCLEFIRSEKWPEAEESLKWSEWDLTEEDTSILKRMLIFHKDGMKTCIALWKVNVEVAREFILWCLTPEELPAFQKNLICSPVGKKECRKLCITNQQIADDFLEWCLPSESHTAFKALLLEEVGSICMCTKYVLKNNTPELADRLVQWCLPNEDIIKEFKKYLGHHKIEIYPTYIFRDIENCTDDDFPDKLFDWEPEEKMFKWCFESDPEEIKKFKVMFLKKSRREIIYKCIESNKWDVADKYISWLKLDSISLRMAKTEQLCSDTETGELLSNLLARKENDPIFAESGGKQKTIERFIHWFLVDDVSIVSVFIKRLERYIDDIIVQNVITKLKGDKIEDIKGLLMES